MAKNFDYEGARKAGYSDQEINSFIGKSAPKFDENAARQAGYSQQEVDQYLSSQSKQGGIRGEVERSVVGPAAELATRAAYSTPNTVKGVSGLVNKGVNSLIQSLGGKGLSEDQLNQVNKLVGASGPFANFPEKEQLEKALKQVTGGRLEPTNERERIIKGGAGVIGDIVGMPGGAGAAFGTPAKTAGTLALAATTPSLEEAGAHPLVALGGGIAADLLTRSGIGLGKKLSGVFSKGIAKSLGEEAAKAAKLTPAEIKQGVIDSAKRIGISQGEIPLNAQANSAFINGVETRLRESSLSGPHFSRQLANVEKKTRTAYEDIANQISTRQDLLPAAVSEEAVSQLKNIEQKASQGYSDLYRQATQALPKNAVSDPSIGKTILKHLDDQVEKLGRGAGTPAKDALKNRLGRLAGDWKQRFPNGNIPIQELIDLKKDLNQIIKYEVRGGVDKTLNPLLHMSKNAIQRYGKGNSPFLFRFNEAERKFANSAKTFRKNDAVSSLLETQNPQQILNKMKNVKTHRELESLFGRTAEGKEAFQDLNRYLLEDIIGSKLLNKNKEVSWGNTAGMMKNPKNREIVQQIIGKQSFDKLKDIQKFTSGIEEGLKKFANLSGSATKGWDIAAIIGTIGKGLGQIFTGSPIKGAKTMSYILVPRVMARLMTNPEFIQAMSDVAHAGKGTNPNLFYEASERAARFIVPAVLESYSSEDKENDSE